MASFSLQSQRLRAGALSLETCVGQGIGWDVIRPCLAPTLDQLAAVFVPASAAGLSLLL